MEWPTIPHTIRPTCQKTTSEAPLPHLEVASSVPSSRDLEEERAGEIGAMGGHRPAALQPGHWPPWPRSFGESPPLEAAYTLGDPDAGETHIPKGRSHPLSAPCAKRWDTRREPPLGQKGPPSPLLHRGPWSDENPEPLLAPSHGFTIPGMEPKVATRT